MLELSKYKYCFARFVTTEHFGVAMQQTAHQLSLFSGAEEAQMFHESGRAGFFSILVDVNGNKRQSSHRLTEMLNVIELIDKNRDTWISQAEFILPNRRVVNLARVGLLF